MSNESFRSIELLEGREIVNAGEPSALTDWYLRIRDVPIKDFEVGDMCRAIRQAIHLKHVMPRALEMFELNPLDGELYDGELLCAFNSIPLTFWSHNTDLAKRMYTLIKQTTCRYEFDEDSQKALAALVGKLHPILGR